MVKPMSRLLRDIALFSGNTILGDGSVIMIIDPNGSARSSARSTADAQRRQRPPRREREHWTKRLPAAVPRRRADTKAVPLSLDHTAGGDRGDTIERCNGEDVVQYRGALMPLVYIDRSAAARRRRAAACWCSPKAAGRWASPSTRSWTLSRSGSTSSSKTEKPGVIGAAIIRGKAVEIVDVSHYLPTGLR